MDLPEYVTELISRLEEHGFSAYVVGGCVRDACLGLTPHDYDMCTSATPEQIRAVFEDYPMYLAGEKHGTVSIICGKEVVEITTYRTESGYTDNRHPDHVAFVSDIEQDLARRDYTVNAMAWSPSRGFADPFGGREDLKNKILRTVGNPEARFREDSLRILRGARFSVRFGLTPEPETRQAMFRLTPLMDNLARERVFDELCRFLPLASAEDLLTFAPIITQVIPELQPTLGFDQRNPHHAYDLYTHIAHVVEHSPGTLHLRWAALLHDVGKPATFSVDEQGCGHFYGHDEVSARMADDILHRLKAPSHLREQAVWIIAHHMMPLEADRRLLRRRVRQYGMARTRDLLSQEYADFSSKGVHTADDGAHFAQIRSILDELEQEDACLKLSDLAVSGTDLLSIGYAPGKQLGQCLNHLLNLVVDEVLPNQKEPLLEEAEKRRLQS